MFDVKSQDTTATRIARRTRGQNHGPITRLMSPSDFGRLLKPFVFLDLIDNHGKPFSGFGLHPHSGIATLTYVARTDADLMDFVHAAGADGREDLVGAKSPAGKEMPSNSSITLAQRVMDCGDGGHSATSELTGRSKTPNGDVRPSAPVILRSEAACSAEAQQRRQQDRRQRRPSRAAVRAQRLFGVK